jgi:hypothetical protein
MRHHVPSLLFVSLLAPFLIAQSETRTAELQTNVVATLEFDTYRAFPETEGRIRFEYDIRTNATVVVSAENTPAHRFERDLDQRVLTTQDTLPTFLELQFIERPECPDGSPMEVRPLGDGSFCVAPHRGGFTLVGVLTFGEAKACHDAGCYTSTVTVSVSVLPSEELQ